MLKRVKSFAGDISQLGLDRKGKVDKVVGRIQTPESRRFPDPKEAIHFVNFAYKSVLQQS